MNVPGAPPAPSVHWSRSLRVRLLAVTLAGVAVAMVLAGLVLSGLFREHVQQQFQAALQLQLDQITARLEFDAQGQPVIAAEALSDPRWLKPYSGLYWQVDAMAPDGRERAGVLRSRSLWDTSLALQVDALADGAVHVHEMAGPQGAPLLVLERTVRADAEGVHAARWRLMVAADLHATQAATARFTGVLALSLAVLLVLLAAAAWAQVALGLKPLQALQRAVQDVQEARASQLQGSFPAEVQPLVDDFNAVLRRHGEVVERARTQAGNLAHALKTPLTVLDNAARAQTPTHGPELAALVREQVVVARRHIDWHLARSRVAASAHLPGQRTALQPVVEGLVRVMNKVHADRALDISVVQPPVSLFFAGESQDLQEMLGNLLDNACKWARSAVRLQAQLLPAGSEPAQPQLVVAVEDDGPGINAAQRAQALERGVRLDETVPGTGLGLAIVQDLAALYGGRLDLEPAGLGGLRATLTLPAANAH
ncbi:MAG: histidine kinase [Acidovorax sp. SCN 65-28]|uniref:sensor histidine kinase n=1 Tax=Acidovorax sp. TaxID=1872122 RepID=UPI00086D7CDF|nr:sensor histidine kinase [Acidovorax sp.]MBN9627601.1 sensor histidine kinase [Acidovorax sp.]ODS78332.1 MAG: histidine kinase [Acidovorax sp. SCN 65-28]